MAELDVFNLELRELKSQNVSEEELEEMYQKTKSYEALFSKKSSQIKPMALDVNSFTENDFKYWILQHYSFLKRPVLITKDVIYVGNSKENIGKLVAHFGKKIP